MPRKWRRHERIPHWEHKEGDKEYDDATLCRILNKYRGEFSPKRPENGSPKSTIIRLWDIALIAGIARNVIYCLATERRPCAALVNGIGSLRRARLTYFLDLIEGGFVTKDGHKNYTFHEKPQIKKMKISIGGNLSIAPVIPTVEPIVKKQGNVFDILKG